MERLEAVKTGGAVLLALVLLAFPAWAKRQAAETEGRSTLSYSGAQDQLERAIKDSRNLKVFNLISDLRVEDDRVVFLEHSEEKVLPKRMVFPFENLKTDIKRSPDGRPFVWMGEYPLYFSSQEAAERYVEAALVLKKGGHAASEDDGDDDVLTGAVAESLGSGKRTGKKLNLAVLTFKAEGVAEGGALIVSDMLRTELVKTKSFNIVEKENMAKVLAEHAFQAATCEDEKCAVEMGKVLQVKRMVMGSYGKLMEAFFVNVRVVDVQSAKIVYADSAEGATLAQLKKAIHALALKMAKKM